MLMYIYNNRQDIYEQINPCIPPEYSFIRGFNALPGLPPVDVYINDILRVRNFKYKDMTRYMPLGPGNYNVQFFPTGTKDKPILTIRNLDVPLGQIVTFALLGSTEDINLISIIDDINVHVAPNETKIRFYNLDGSPITFNMSLPIGSIYRSLSSGEGTEYIEINPGEHNFQVRSANQNIRPRDVRINIKPGRIYTLYVTGSIDPASPGYVQGNIPQIILTVDGNTLFYKCI